MPLWSRYRVAGRPELQENSEPSSVVRLFTVGGRMNTTYLEYSPFDWLKIVLMAAVFVVFAAWMLGLFSSGE